MTVVASPVGKKTGSTGLTSRLSQWLASKRKRASRFTLSQKNIYIFPSKAGLSFCFMLAVMLLTAINYQNSLVYLLTFILGAIFKVSIWLCFFNLRGLEIEAVESPELFEGEALRFRLRLSREQGGSYGLELTENNSEEFSYANVESGQDALVELVAKKAKRGLHRIDRLGMKSYYPFGLVRAWTWLGLNAEAIVYPRPIAPEQVERRGKEDNVGKDSKSSQLDLLRNYQKGDTPSRVHWKKYASAEQLVVRDAEHTSSEGVWLRWQDFQEHGTETALSYLCYAVLEYSKTNVVFGLELPGGDIEPNSGPAHRKACLKRLALFGDAGSIGGEHG